MKVYNEKHTSMNENIQKTLGIVRNMRGFDVDTYIKAKANILNRYMRSSGLDACVVALSGGIDSAIVLALVKYASKQSGSPITKIVGVTIPSYDGSVTNQAETVIKAKELCACLNIECKVLEITHNTTNLASKIERMMGMDEELDPWARGQIVSYLRTPSLYYFTSVLNSQNYRPILVGTINRDEGAYLGYMCKSGDNCVDVHLISDLHKSEVYQVGKALKVPEIIMNAVPTGDMYDDRSDEEVFGAPYDFVELFLSFKGFTENTVANITNLWNRDDRLQYKKYSTALEKLHSYNAHKYTSGSVALHLDVMQAGVDGGWIEGVHSSIHKKTSKTQIIQTHKFTGFVSEAPELNDFIDIQTNNSEKNTISCTRNILSKSECEALENWVHSNQNKMIRSDEYGKNKESKENGSLRLSFYDETFAQTIFERLQMAQAFEPLRIFDRVKNVNDKTNWRPHIQWRAVGVNPLFRVLSYDEGSFLQAHYDDSYIQDKTRKSLQSLVIVVKSATKGGATRFLHDMQEKYDFEDRDFSDWTCETNNSDIKISVMEAGMAINFDHRELHDGQKVESGEKIILRTDIIYENCDFLVE